MPALRLHAIMPTSRPANLHRILIRMLQEMEPHPFELRWHIAAQGPEPDPKGFLKVNECIVWIPADDWFYTPSDDKLDSPALYRRLGEVIAANPDAGAIVVSEQRPPCEGNRILHATPDQMHPCLVDGSQVFWKRSFLSNETHDFAQYAEQADGKLIEKMYAAAPQRFVFVDEVLVAFNSI